MLESLGQLTKNPDGNPVVQVMAKHAPTWLIQFPSLVKAEQREALQREILGATRERMVREICEALEAITIRSRSEEHTSELQSRQYLVCRLLLEKKNTALISENDIRTRKLTHQP